MIIVEIHGLLCCKVSQGQPCIKHLISMIRSQFNTTVNQVRLDNGLEYSFPKFFSAKSIVHQTSRIATRQQNIRDEHKHQQI